MQKPTGWWVLLAVRLDQSLATFLIGHPVVKVLIYDEYLGHGVLVVINLDALIFAIGIGENAISDVIPTGGGFGKFPCTLHALKIQVSSLAHNAWFLG